MTNVGFEAHGCEQLAQSRRRIVARVRARPWIELATSLIASPTPRTIVPARHPATVDVITRQTHLFCGRRRRRRGRRDPARAHRSVLGRFGDRIFAPVVSRRVMVRVQGRDLIITVVLFCSVLFFSRPRSEGWPHRGRTFSIHLCSLSF